MAYTGPDPARTDARRARRRRRLGPGAACAVCGESDPLVLTTSKRRIVQAHHVVGRRHDPDLTVVLCLNCHARATEALEQAGVSMQPAATLLEREIATHVSLAAFLRQLTDARLRQAARLERFQAGLD